MVGSGAPVIDPFGPKKGNPRVVRGGSWGSDRDIVRCALPSQGRARFLQRQSRFPGGALPHESLGFLKSWFLNPGLFRGLNDFFGAILASILYMPGSDILYFSITSFENLHHAFKNRAKASAAKPDVAAFEYNLEEELLDLEAELLHQSWQPSPYCSFYIHDPKRRLISAAPFFATV